MPKQNLQILVYGDYHTLEDILHPNKIRWSWPEIKGHDTYDIKPAKDGDPSELMRTGNHN